MVSITRTIHKLPFDQLDPKRFEDLVRQLAYEFRNWRTLEATGASGSDDGFDARGWEITGETDDVSIDDNSAEGDDESLAPNTDRLWLIQCKREKRIGPKKLLEYFEAIPPEARANLYGIIFAVTAELSKAARDAFIGKCRAAGISECHFWSRSELEDLLFQPKNDGLLFAYFGISLRIKRRQTQSSLRTKLAAKRKITRAFGSGHLLMTRALFLDPDDQSYPYRYVDQKREDLLWRHHDIVGHHPWGLRIIDRKRFAYLAEDSSTWDVADVFDEATYGRDEPWTWEEEVQAQLQQYNAVFSAWEKIPATCRGRLTVTGIVGLENILDIDRDGDKFSGGPIIYSTFSDGRLPLVGMKASIRIPAIHDSQGALVSPPREHRLQSPTDNRVAFFPAFARKPASE